MLGSHDFNRGVSWRFTLNVFVDLSCQTLENSWKWMSPLQVAISLKLDKIPSQSATPLTFLARLSPLTNFIGVWLTIQNSLGLAEVHQQRNSTQLQKMKAGGFRQLKHTTLPAHSTSRAQALPAWPACLSAAADLSQSYMCLSLHPPHLLCWHCSFKLG